MFAGQLTVRTYLEHARAPVAPAIGGLAGRGWDIFGGEPKAVPARVRGRPRIVAPTTSKGIIRAGAGGGDVNRAEGGVIAGHHGVGGAGKEVGPREGEHHG